MIYQSIFWNTDNRNLLKTNKMLPMIIYVTNWTEFQSMKKEQARKSQFIQLIL